MKDDSSQAVDFSVRSFPKRLSPKFPRFSKFRVSCDSGDVSGGFSEGSVLSDEVTVVRSAMRLGARMEGNVRF